MDSNIVNYVILWVHECVVKSKYSTLLQVMGATSELENNPENRLILIILKISAEYLVNIIMELEIRVEILRDLIHPKIESLEN